MKKKRLQNWPKLFAEKIDELSAKPFVWGEHDCCLFSADVIAAITGIDPMEKLRGTYSTAYGAHKAIDDLGGLESAADALTSAHGWGEIAPAFMGRGDLAIFNHLNGTSLGICDGAFILGTSESGLVSVPRAVAIKSWRIG
jgi:hypothetical protein